VGGDAARWNSFSAERTLVVATRTVTSAVRVLECLPSLLRGDERVGVVFAHDPGSAFGDGVLDLLRNNGCQGVVPWAELPSAGADLILSASENLDLPDGDSPVLVLPHGVGFQKYVPDARGPGERLSGMVPDRLLEAGRAWLAISHPEQEAQLVAAHPKVAGHTLLVGDPCLDDLRACARQAGAHKAALGIDAERRLVVVSSTWGRTSLLGRHPGLPAELLAGLPMDEYAVAAVVHPNVWARHGGWNVRRVLAPALESGLLLMPPVHRWRQALVAADAVIGDHGSVTLYGAALGKPVLLAAFGEDSVPGTAAELLSRAAGRFDPHGDVRGQLADAISGHTPDRYAPVAAAAFAEPGQALARLREEVYRLLRLPEPRTPTPGPLSLPHDAIDATPPTAWRVVTTTPAPGTVTVVRHPAAVPAGAGDPAGGFGHLAADESERDPRRLESASVLTRNRPHASRPAAVRWARDTLAAFPGARLAVTVVPGGHLAVLRDGRAVEAAATGPARDAGVIGAVVYTCLRAGWDLDGFVTLRLGDLPEQDVALLRRPPLA
jgi:hypothetical protein